MGRQDNDFHVVKAFVFRQELLDIWVFIAVFCNVWKKKNGVLRQRRLVYRNIRTIALIFGQPIQRTAKIINYFDWSELVCGGKARSTILMKLMSVNEPVLAIGAGMVQYAQ